MQYCYLLVLVSACCLAHGGPYESACVWGVCLVNGGVIVVAVIRCAHYDRRVREGLARYHSREERRARGSTARGQRT